MNLFENRGCGTASFYIVQGILSSSGTLNQQGNIFLQTNTFIILAFSLRNTYFNTVIKLHIYKPSGGFGKLSLSLLRQLKRFMCHALTLPIQHTWMWVSCQNHMHTCSLLLWSLSFLYMGVAPQLVRPQGREPHQSHQCNPNNCHKNAMWKWNTWYDYKDNRNTIKSRYPIYKVPWNVANIDLTPEYVMAWYEM